MALEIKSSPLTAPTAQKLQQRTKAEGQQEKNSVCIQPGQVGYKSEILQGPQQTCLLDGTPKTKSISATKSTEPRYLETREQADELVQELIAESFPELTNVKIEVKSKKFSDPLSSFHSHVSIGKRLLSLLPPWKKPPYVIDVNSAMFERKMPMEIAKAVLAHELSHSIFYVEQGILGDLKGLWSRIASKKYARRFERITDLEAVRRGYADGLAAYVEWFYPTLSEDQRKDKAAKYLCAEELREAAANPHSPLWNEWHNYWPNAEQKKIPGR